VRLYLDEMISPRVAEGLRGRGHDVVAAAERATLGNSDARQLAEAIQEGRALVTFDVRDFSVLAKAAAVAGTEHWGIVLLSPARFSRSSIGGLVRALERLLSRNPDPESMKNRALFLDSE
jgi:predicted nuclease of predicted toxin-antitoxin system